jgi:hypothetical protein
MGSAVLRLEPRFSLSAGSGVMFSEWHGDPGGQTPKVVVGSAFRWRSSARRSCAARVERNFELSMGSTEASPTNCGRVIATWCRCSTACRTIRSCGPDGALGTRSKTVDAGQLAGSSTNTTIRLDLLRGPC